MLLTIRHPWRHTQGACAKSQAGFSSLILRADIAAMRHFLCPKKVLPFCFQWADMREASRPAGLLAGLLTRIICPPTAAKPTGGFHKDQTKGAINHE